MKIKLLFFFVICVSQFSLGQHKDYEVEIVNHEVQSDDSVRALSKKYSVDPADIYKLNRFAVNGISEGMVLQIPIRKKESFSKQDTPSDNLSQEVASVNNDAEEDKKIAIELEINKELESTSVESESDVIQHIVEPKETIFGLSKKYHVTVEEIQSVNPKIQQTGLQTGEVIIIPSRVKKDKKETPVTIVTTNQKLEAKKTEEYIQHKVLPKETLFGLSKKYNVSVDEIKEKNEVVVKNGLQIGQILIIRKN